MEIVSLKNKKQKEKLRDSLLIEPFCTFSKNVDVMHTSCLPMLHSRMDNNCHNLMP
jgi:hypothetical protein